MPKPFVCSPPHPIKIDECLQHTMTTAAARSEVQILASQAVVLFSIGLIEDASHAWSAALALLAPLLPDDAAESCPDPTRPGFAGGTVRFTGTYSVHSILSGSTLSPPGCLRLDDRIFSVYACAVHYRPGRGPRPAAREADRAGESLASEAAAAERHEDLGTAVACLYNLGLCCHLRSLLGVSTAETDLRRAERCYRTAQSVFSKATFGGMAGGAALRASRGGDAVPAGARVLGLALLNNLGCVHDRRYDLAASLAALEALRSLLAPVAAAVGARDGHLLGDAGVEPEAFLPFLVTATLHPGGERAGTGIHAPCA
jgi:hypothetical protein